MEEIEKKLYIITLNYNNTIKRLYLEGDNSDDARTKLEKACGGIKKIADSSNNFFIFLENAIQHFKNYGFIRIQK